MTGREHLVVVLPGIGGSVLQDPHTKDRVWDTRLGAFLGLGFSPDRLNVAEHPELTPAGLVSSYRLVPGWTIIHGYDMLLDRLAALPGAKLDRGDPEHRVPNPGRS